MDMVVAKSDLAVAARYAGLAGGDAPTRRIFREIRREFERTSAVLGLLTGQSTRLAGNPALARSIRHRTPYIDPLNHLQIELLRRHRAAPTAPDADRVRLGIHLSINGVATALRNTG
jgi:phosphoenolpyruvate carboxylase